MALGAPSPWPGYARAVGSRGVERFRFRFSSGARWAVPLITLGATEGTSSVEVGAGRLRARFGPWKVDTPIENVAGAEVTGPYRAYRAIGLRVSVSDHGASFGSNAERGVCIRFHEPVRSVTPLWPVRHPNLTVTVDDPDRLVAAIDRERRASGASTG
jgi:hypothetical protein